jgi:hypothetical protein
MKPILIFFKFLPRNFELEVLAGEEDFEVRVVISSNSLFLDYHKFPRSPNF